MFYTPNPSASAGRIEKEVMTLFAAYSYLAEAAHQRYHPSEEFVVTRRYSSLIELLIVDEANRLKDMGLEQIRDIADRGEIGLVLLGMPGLDMRLQRVPQLYSRIGFVHEIEPLSQQETRFFLAQRWSHRISAHSEDFTDQEAVATLIRITQGNMRLCCLPDKTSILRQIKYPLSGFESTSYLVYLQARFFGFRHIICHVFQQTFTGVTWGDAA